MPGGRKYELVLRERVSELRRKSEATLSRIVTVDSLGVASGPTADIDTRSWIEEKFVINLGQEEVEAILSGWGLSFRFYFGPLPVTYEIRGWKFVVLRKVLQTR